MLDVEMLVSSVNVICQLVPSCCVNIATTKAVNIPSDINYRGIVK